MSSRFVRSSKYRHVFGTPAKKEACYDSVKVSRDAHDSNLCKANPNFISVNWQASGGGAFAVIPLEKLGKLPPDFPLFTGHLAPVLDTDFHPFNDFVIASASEDCKVMIWSIPQGGPTENVDSPLLSLSGHGRKVGHVLFHPTADNLLASSSTDLTIKLWDIVHGSCKLDLIGHLDTIHSMTFNYNGTLMATTCKDKKIRIFDIRSGTVIQEADSHQGVKGARIVWLGEENKIVTTGFSKTSDRQVFLWNASNLSTPVKSENLDTSSGILMPFFDNDTKMLYLAGKGDGNLRYFEIEGETLHFLSEHKSSEPQRGMAFLPKRAIHVSENEIARAFKVLPDRVEPISFKVPRKSDAFQHDIFPKTIAGKAALTCEEFFEGKEANPILISLEQGFVPEARKELVVSAIAVASNEDKEPKGPITDKEYRDAYHAIRKENCDLKNELAIKNVKIRQFETQLESLGIRTSLSRTSSKCDLPPIQQQ